MWQVRPYVTSVNLCDHMWQVWQHCDHMSLVLSHVTRVTTSWTFEHWTSWTFGHHGHLEIMGIWTSWTIGHLDIMDIFSDMLLLSQCLAPPTGWAGHTLILVAFLAPAWPIVPNLRCSLFQADTYTRWGECNQLCVPSWIGSNSRGCDSPISRLTVRRELTCRLPTRLIWGVTLRGFEPPTFRSEGDDPNH